MGKAFKRSVLALFIMLVALHVFFPACTDSDGGIKPERKGLSTNSTLSFTEYCIDVKAVNESFCRSGQERIFFQKRACPGYTVCGDGACRQCYDSDGGSVYSVKGITYDVRTVNNPGADFCTGSILKEYYCNYYGNIMESSYDCKNQNALCKDGECIKCIDSDGGNNPFAPGSVRDVSSLKIDSCINSNSVKEFYCDGSGKSVSEEVDCPSGCATDSKSFGYCISSCTDSDGGLDTAVRGTAQDATGTAITDSCIDASRVAEAYCDGTDSAAVSYISCPAGQECASGTCVPVGSSPYSCADSDGGLADFGYRGTVTITEKSTGAVTETAEDECIPAPWDSSKTVLLELYCSTPNDQFPSSVIRQCSTLAAGSVCDQGRCTNVGTACTQSTVSGRTEVVFNGITYKDYCGSDGKSHKVSCETPNGPVKDVAFECQNGFVCPYGIDEIFSCGSLAKTCVDSDAGDNPGTGGMVTVTENGIPVTYHDSCSGTSLLGEFVCDSGSSYALPVAHSCSNDCQNDLSGNGYCTPSAVAGRGMATSILSDSPKAIELCIPAIMIAVVFGLALAFMLAKGFGLSQVEQLIRSEFVELFYAAIQLIFLLGLFSVFASFQLAPDTKFIDYSIKVLDRLNFNYASLFNLIAENYANMMKIFSFSYDYTFNKNYLVSSYNSVSPLSGYVPLANSGQKLGEQISHLMTFNSLVKFIVIITQNAGTLLFALAFSLRIIPFTRGIGIALMSLLIAFMFFLPLGIVLMEYITDGSARNIEGILSRRGEYTVYAPADPPDMGMVCSPVMQVFVDMGEVSLAAMICPFLQPTIPYPVCQLIVTMIFVSIHHLFSVGMSGQLENYINSAVSSPELFKAEYLEKMLKLFDAVTYASVSNIVSYVIIMLMLLSVTRSISIALGGEVNLHGLGKVV